MLELFAQRQAPPAGAEAGVAAIVGVLYCGFILAGIAVFASLIFLYIRMSNTLTACRPRNRQMEPGQVWLNLIPLFQLVWLILSVIKISDSLRDEYDDRGLRGDDDFGKTMGIIFFVTTLFCFPINLIFIFLYASKLGGYIEELKRDNRRSRRDNDDDDVHDEYDD